MNMKSNFNWGYACLHEYTNTETHKFIIVWVSGCERVY